jgi:membrane protein implicated in regulation of membrane protease activity
MTDLALTAGFWLWWILAAILLVLELLLPGVFLVWIGLAAFATGLCVLLGDFPWQGQVALFAVLSVLSVLLGRYWFGRSVADDTLNLNRRHQSYVGRRYRLDVPIVDGRGRLRIDDAYWQITGPDAPAGAWVKVVRTDGLDLVVELD